MRERIRVESTEKIWLSQYPEEISATLHYEQKNLAQLFEEAVQKDPKKNAIYFLGKKMTFSQLHQDSLKLSSYLIELGLKKGDRVAIMLPNCPQAVISFYAVLLAGGVVVQTNPLYTERELEYQLNDSEATMIIALDLVYPRVVKMKALTSIEHVVITSIQDYLPFPKNVLYPFIQRKQQKISVDVSHTETTHLFKRIINESSPAVCNAEGISDEDIAILQYTGGTTGFPKGVMLSHHNIVNNGFLVAQSMKLTNEDRLCIPVPFFHCFGCVLGVLACVSVGATMLPIIEFQPSSVLRTVEKEKCTALHGVPTMFIAELNALEFNQYDLSTLRTGIMAGSNCPAEVMKRVINDMGINEITIAYGQTETSPVITQTTPTDSIERRVQTVGKVHDHVQIQIINPVTGKQASFGEQGELCAKGYLTMKGYYKMPEETEKTIVEGWLHTGDLATIDKDGYVKITGRLKDMIIRGGENIYPREIEEFLYRIPEVEDVQIVGIPDPKYGERVAACIKLKQHSFLTAQEIKDFCKGKLAHFKIPEHIYFIDDFPMTASGKIQKYKLKEKIVALYK